jgi:NitT/TauT family transport system permease protein
VYAPAVVTFALLVLVWELAVSADNVSPLVLPTPGAIARNVGDHFGDYVHDALVTLEEALLGFVVAFVVSAVLAVAMVHSRLIRHAIDPVAVAIRCLPVVALAPALALWLGFGVMPKVIVVALITFPPFLVNMVTGLRTVDVSMLEILESVNASKREILMKLRVPHALPYVFSAAKVCTTLALIGAVVGEWSASSEGLGYRIIRAQQDLATTTVWGAIAVLAVIGILLTLIVSLIERRTLRWMNPHE